MPRRSPRAASSNARHSPPSRSSLQPVPSSAPADQRAAYGRFSTFAGAQEVGDPPSAALARSAPRAPRALLEWIHRELGSTPGTDTRRVVITALDLLNLSESPADLRAVTFRMLALLPGAEVTEGATTFDGRHATAVVFTEGPHREELLIDPVSAELIGGRTAYTVSAVVAHEGARP